MSTRRVTLNRTTPTVVLSGAPVVTLAAPTRVVSAPALTGPRGPAGAGSEAQDTGWLDITLGALAAAGPNPGLYSPTNPDWHSVLIRRVGPIVSLAVAVTWGGAAATLTETVLIVPAGFRPTGQEATRPFTEYPTGDTVSSRDFAILYANSPSPGRLRMGLDTLRAWANPSVTLTYLTDDPWPETLPGVPT